MTLLPTTNPNRVSPSGMGNLIITSNMQGAAGSAAGQLFNSPLRLGFLFENAVIQEVRFIAQGTPAVGESMTIDIQVDGVSILANGTPFTYDDNLSGRSLIIIPIPQAERQRAIGEIITVDRVYVAGGGPTPIGANKVEIVLERLLVTLDEAAP